MIPSFNHSPCNDFLAPYLRRHRFSEAVYTSRHSVFPVHPGAKRGVTGHHINSLVDLKVPREQIAGLDAGQAEVGFPVGVINDTTVIEVRSAAAQAWMDELENMETPQIWTPEARYFLYRRVADYNLPPADDLMEGLRLVNDGEWIPYPGNIMAGQLVHWEFEPSAVAYSQLPYLLWDESAKSAA